jgi:hypothetical protein
MKYRYLRQIQTWVILSIFTLAVLLPFSLSADDPPPTPPGGSSGGGSGTGGSDITRNGATGAPIDRKAALLLVLTACTCFGTYLLYRREKESEN